MTCDRAEAQLLAAYRHVDEERMRGLPICNPALGVEAVGFRDWQGDRLGVLLTPWFMNLVLIPGAAGGRSGPVRTGEYRLPSGRYEFQLCRFAGAPEHWSLPLFSTMHGFPDGATARAVAVEVMAGIMTDAAGAPQAAGPETLGAAPVSRRELLRRWLGSGE